MKSYSVKELVHISIGKIELEGELIIPLEAKGIVIFAHGSGSSRLSPRNQFVGRFLQKKQLGTLLVDLLTIEEEKIDQLTREIRFDIELLANRLFKITQWLRQDPRIKLFQLGYFGSSTGAAAALIAAAKMGESIAAIVSRGGRPDLAHQFLSQIRSPTLLIVGGADEVVIDLNQQAYALLSGIKKLEIVPRATHLFEESGALEQVADLASKWFLKYFYKI